MVEERRKKTLVQKLHLDWATLFILFLTIIYYAVTGWTKLGDCICDVADLKTHSSQQDDKQISTDLGLARIEGKIDLICDRLSVKK